MPTLITLIEPAGLSLAPELTIALARRRRRETRRRLVVVDIDTTGRLAERVRAEGPEGIRLSAIEPTVSDGLLALSNEPYLTETPRRLRTETGEYVRGGAGSEIAWRRVESAALATGLALPVVDRLRSLLTDEVEGRETIAFAPPGMGALAASMVAASDAVVMVVPEEADPSAVRLAQQWAHSIGMARGKGAIRFLGRIMTSPRAEEEPKPVQPVQRSGLPSAIGDLRRLLYLRGVRFDPDTPMAGIENVGPWRPMRGLEMGHLVASRIWRQLGEVGL